MTVTRSHPAARARSQQFIGENRRFMSFSGNSARMGIRYVPAADVASLFSEPDVLGADPGG